MDDRPLDKLPKDDPPGRYEEGSTAAEIEAHVLMAEAGDEADADSERVASMKRLVVPNYNPVESLLGKLDRWLLQQPEWALILSAPRKTRRAAITLLSKRMLTIPNRYSKFNQEG